jgi:hypothetical protein
LDGAGEARLVVGVGAALLIIIATAGRIIVPRILQLPFPPPPFPLRPLSLQVRSPREEDAAAAAIVAALAPPAAETRPAAAARRRRGESEGRIIACLVWSRQKRPESRRSGKVTAG